MKKVVVFALALALLLSLGAPALAFSAQLSAQNLSVNGKTITCEKYNIDGSNYFKLRDLAQLLNGTESQFDVGWDGAKGVVSITTNHAYTTPNGTELVVGADQSATAQVSAQTIMINGQVRSDLTVYNIGGSNFFKLREMGDALGFAVDYDAATNTAIVKSNNAKALIYSRENFIYEVPASELEASLAKGYTAEPRELVIEAAGGDWLLAGAALLLRNTEKYQSFSGNLADLTAKVQTLWFTRGSKYVNFNESSIFGRSGSGDFTRVEIADTVTQITETFRNNITRIGIPANVKLEDVGWLKFFPESAVIYGVPGSEAEEYAKIWGNPFVAASPLYAPDGRVIMVSESERALYLGNGWYDYPVARVYAPDGRTMVVSEKAVADNVAVGWECFDCKVADTLCASKGYSAAVDYLDGALKSVSQDLVPALKTKQQQFFESWQQSIGGSPVAIVGYSVGTYYGTPTVTVTFRNLTQKKVNRVDLIWTCVDAYGKATADYSWYNGQYEGYSEPGNTIDPAGTMTLTWHLYSNSQTTDIRDYYMTGVAFADGTSWHR